MSWYGSHPEISKIDIRKLLPRAVCKSCVYWFRVYWTRRLLPWWEHHTGLCPNCGVTKWVVYPVINDLANKDDRSSSWHRPRTGASSGPRKLPFGISSQSDALALLAYQYRFFNAAVSSADSTGMNWYLGSIGEYLSALVTWHLGESDDEELRGIWASGWTLVRASIATTQEISVEAMMFWSDGTGAQVWLAPFSAHLRFIEASGAISWFELLFGVRSSSASILKTPRYPSRAWKLVDSLRPEKREGWSLVVNEWL